MSTAAPAAAVGVAEDVDIFAAAAALAADKALAAAYQRLLLLLHL
jgi:hypothetical protein